MDRPFIASVNPAHDPVTARQMFAVGAWFQLMVIGGGTALAAVIELATGESHAPAAVMFAVAGAAVATFAWKRFWRMLGEEPPKAAAPAGFVPTQSLHAR